jgi:hypothetical protein
MEPCDIYGLHLHQVVDDFYNQILFKSLQYHMLWDRGSSLQPGHNRVWLFVGRAQNRIKISSKLVIDIFKF